MYMYGYSALHTDTYFTQSTFIAACVYGENTVLIVHVSLCLLLSITYHVYMIVQCLGAETGNQRVASSNLIHVVYLNRWFFLCVILARCNGHLQLTHWYLRWSQWQYKLRYSLCPLSSSD